MKVAVTGGSGVVGSALIRHLSDEGHEVRALARSPIAESELVSSGADPVRGDLLDASSLRTLVGGAQWVFHVAGMNELCPRDPDLMWRVNVEGSRAVMAVCREAGVERLVHTSSAVTIGQEQGTIGREDTPHRGYYLSEYERSKHEAEKAMLGEADGLDVVVVNPSSVQGPGRSTGTGRVLLAAVRGRLPFLVDTTISLVDIDDCARGHLLAAEHGVAGERYLLSGSTLTMREALSFLTDVTGSEISPRFVSPVGVRLLAAAVEVTFGLTRKQPPICRETARVMLHGHRYDATRSSIELGLEYTPVAETLRRTVAWFRQEGLLGDRPVGK